MKQRKLCAVLLSFTLIVGFLACPARTEQVQAAEQGTGNPTELETEFVGLDAEYHTQEEIREYYKNHPVTNMEPEYNIEPSVTQPYAIGELTEETKQDALNLLNLYRYIAGVPTASISEEAQNYAQAGAMISAINGHISHYPARPEGISDELYNTAFFGCSHSNITTKGTNLCDSIHGYMLETGGDAEYGHRRRMLNYDLTDVGFGIATTESQKRTCSTLYVDADFKEDKIISYPGQNQPLEYFGTGYAWSVIIPETADHSKIHITVTDTKTGDKWEFSEATENLVLSDASGGGACALFAPRNIAYRDGDCYRVEITGLSRPISYDVNMFYLHDYVPLESIRFNVSEILPFEGESGYRCLLYCTPDNASNKIVTWSSSDPDIAEAVWDGTSMCRIIAKKVGTAIITATSEDGGHTANLRVTVKPKATSVILSETDITVGVGQTAKLSGRALPEESDDSILYSYNYDKNIISTEDMNDLSSISITGKAVGKTTVTAYAASNRNVEAVCNVNVVEPVYTEKICLDNTELELLVGETAQLNTRITPENITCREQEWSSSDTSIVRVKDGLVTAVGENWGEAVVTVKAKDGSNQTAECKITVYEKHLRMNAPSVVQRTSDTVTLKEVSGCEYSMDGINWQDSNVFAGLEPDHEYTFYIRKKAMEMEYVKAGDTSDGTTVRTFPASSEECVHDHTRIQNKSSATCTEEGYTGDVYCQDCGTVISTGEVITALGHEYISEITKPPTIMGEGIITYACIRCDASYIGILPKLSQENQSVSSGEPVQTNTNQKGDKFAAGVCQYRIMSSSAVEVIGLKNNKTKKLIIPKTVKNGSRIYKIKSIAANAFSKAKITHVTIGSNVSGIGTGAFKNCKRLKKITIQSTKLKSVGKNAFKGIKAKAKIKVPAGKIKAYKKLLKRKGQGKKVKIVK